MNLKEMIDDLLKRGKIEPNEHVALQLMRAKEKLDSLPSDEEVSVFFDTAIPLPNECSSTSAIYKFRLWLKDRLYAINKN